MTEYIDVIFGRWRVTRQRDGKETWYRRVGDDAWAPVLLKNVPIDDALRMLAQLDRARP